MTDQEKPPTPEEQLQRQKDKEAAEGRPKEHWDGEKWVKVERTQS